MPQISATRPARPSLECFFIDEVAFRIEVVVKRGMDRDDFLQ